MRKVLKLKFKNTDDKTTIITISNPKPDLKEDVVKAAMAKIVASGAFEKDGVNLYAKVVGAHYYTTESQAVFADDEAAA